VPARFETLAGWANDFGWTRGVELGVFDGTTFFHLLDHCPQLSMVGIDLWGTSVRTASPTASHEKCHCIHCEATRAKRWSIPKEQADNIGDMVAERALGNPRARIIKADTSQSAYMVEGQVDFVFVDGDHSKAGVSADIGEWLHKVRPGGRLCGHDFNMSSVREAVWLHFAEVNTEDDHLWWITCK